MSCNTVTDQKFNVLTQTQVKATDIDLDQLDATYRRASLNMVMACLACEEAIQKLPHDLDKDDLAVIFATHFGEVESSLSFLKTFEESKMPRPILFQNSLHNSALGFTSIHLGLKGPAMTISVDEETEGSAYLLAETLLENHARVLICFVDHIPLPLMNAYLKRFPFVEKFLNQATCLIVGK